MKPLSPGKQAWHVALIRSPGASVLTGKPRPSTSQPLPLAPFLLSLLKGTIGEAILYGILSIFIFSVCNKYGQQPVNNRRQNHYIQDCPNLECSSDKLAVQHCWLTTHTPCCPITISCQIFVKQTDQTERCYDTYCSLPLEGHWDALSELLRSSPVIHLHIQSMVQWRHELAFLTY